LLHEFITHTQHSLF